MSKNIRKAAVLGSGVMGIGIAAHLANCGIPCLMLDIVLPLSDEDKAKGIKETDPAHRNKLAAGALERAIKARQPMAPFYITKNADLVEVGNFEDDMHKIADCDWVVEVVLERMDIKKKVFAQVAKYWKPGMIITSNTSGLPIKEMSADMPQGMKEHFFVTHFFNPVRHMKLLEFVVGEETCPEIVSGLAGFGERVLGKGIVYGKDTPNFVANRIGVYGIMATMKHMVDLDMSFEEIDAIAGPPMGRPKSAVFRTADLVGLDTFSHVSTSCYDLCPDDEQRDVFKIPDFMKQMVEKGWLGNKSKGGFYKKDMVDGKKAYFMLDYKKMEYVPASKPAFESVKKAKGIDDLGGKIKKLLEGDDKAAKFAWLAIRDSVIYSCNRIPEICDNIVNIDNGMKWGFAWDMGPFETADAIGAKDMVKRIKADGLAVPKLLDQAAKKGGFYKKIGPVLSYIDAVTFEYKPVPKTALEMDCCNLPARLKDAVEYITDPGVKKILISDLKEAGKLITKNVGASLYDMGDAVGLLEFHTYKGMNPVDDQIIEMMMKSIDEVTKRGLIGLVIGNQGQNFSVGANLLMLLMEARAKHWDIIDKVSAGLQNANMAMKYAPFPVVTAPFGMVLGGGLEVAMHGDMICAAAETYCGLVEVGVGVIPAGGGCKEFLLRNVEGTLNNPNVPNSFGHVRKAFENIAMAKVCMNAQEAVEANMLRPTDHITVSKDYLLDDAKQLVIGLAKAGYSPKSPRKDIKMLGRQYYAAFLNAVWTMQQGNYISEHDAIITRWVGKILTGGDVATNAIMTEQDVLDLEREAFVSLCGTEKTQARMEYMLKNNKPLRN